MIENIQNNTILLLPNKIKKKIIEKIRQTKKLLDIKFMSMDEFINNYYFTYDNQTIHYLMTKYHWKYEVCLVYLNNLYYIEDKNYRSEKLRFLKDLKTDLENQNLLKYNKIFKENLKTKNIVVYGYNNLGKFEEKMLEELKKITSVEYLEPISTTYKPECIYKFKNKEEEINFVAIKIIDLINKGIDINKIKIANIDTEYNNELLRIFSFYNIPIYLERKISLYTTSIGKYFKDNLEIGLTEILKTIEQRYKECMEEYNLLIDILNKYSWCENLEEIKDMLIYELKNTFIKEKKRTNQIELIDIKDNIIEDDYYVFLMNFSGGIIPKIYKDEDYITDSIKDELDNIDTTLSQNIKEKNAILKSICSIKNLFITFKEESLNGSYTLSNLNDELNLKIITDFKDNLSYSKLYNELRLASSIDEFIKYGTEKENLSILHNNYKDLKYLKYNNQFTGIDKEKLTAFLDNKLLLSYSTIDNFYRCNFRYYLNNVLKVNPYEDTFMTTLGSLFHDILSTAFNNDAFDLEAEYEKYLKKIPKEFTAKEKFFLNKLKGELNFIINSIKKQMEYCSLNKTMYEEKIYIDKSNDIKITFMGIVDKIIYDKLDEKCIVSIIDYKTGNPQININNTIYGIEMQLPVYLYLVKNSDKFSNVYVAGFYLQKILNNEILRDNKNTYEQLKENNLKLQGYSNEDINILNKFDSSFNDSKIIKSLKTTSKGFASYSKVIDNTKIDKLTNIVDNKINNAIKDIISANFAINPKRIGKINYGCEFCKFKDICFMTENDIVNLKEYKNLEFLGDDKNDTN